MSVLICDYASAARTISGLDVYCEKGKCVHYGRCLPVLGIRQPQTEEAVGSQTRARGEYYHNLMCIKNGGGGSDNVV